MNPSRLLTAETSETSTPAALRRACAALLAMRTPEHFWQERVTADVTLESDYILLQSWLNRKRSDRERIEKAVSAILRRQMPDGGFSRYPAGPSDLDVTATAYAALRVAGLPAADRRMQAARDVVLAHGGLQGASALLKLTFSFFGLYPRQGCAPVAPELLFLPARVLQRVSAYPFDLLAPLSILWSLSVAPQNQALTELFAPGGMPASQRDLGTSLTWLRRQAVTRVEKRLLDRMNSGGLATLHPVTMFTVMALHTLGYPEDHPIRAAAERLFRALIVEDADELRLQPFTGAVRQTALAAIAVCGSGHAQEPGMRRTGDWLLTQEDWRSEPDLAAGVVLALSCTGASDDGVLEACISGPVDWLLDQLSSGTPDVSGHVLEAVIRRGVPVDHASVRTAVERLLRAQEADGSWAGVRGVSYLYGTFRVLRGLRAAGVSDREAPVLRAGEWIRSIQNADGGWGESCDSYGVRSYVAAASTPSQSAWAILGLLAGGDETSLSLSSGINYLVRTQRPDGAWDEEATTGGHFPQPFYSTDYSYRNSFPTLALSSFLQAKRGVS